MQHIIKWKTQHNTRTRSWMLSIRATRKSIQRIRALMPGITDEFIQTLWQDCFEAASVAAETEMKQPSSVLSLSWYEVFEEEYIMPIT